jgi:hypothetical protein
VPQPRCARRCKAKWRDAMTLHASLMHRHHAAGMFSLGSLAAFSSSVTQLGFGAPRPVQRVRAVGNQAAPSAAPIAQSTAPHGGEGGVAPGRILPRGSLLDLSV